MKTYTIQFVIKSIIAFLLLSNRAFAQNFAFPPPVQERNIKGRPAYINYCLMRNIPPPEIAECKPTWSVFYFRVNGKNQVDSIKHTGNLPPFVTQQILENIKATQGHWEIAKGTKKTAYCWFIYPYFRIPDDTPNCSTQAGIKLLKANVRQMIYMMNDLNQLCKANKYVILLDTEYGLNSE